MRVAIIHLGFFYSGGGEKLVIEEMRGLRRLGHHVDCFAPYVDREGCYPGEPEMAEIKALLPHPPKWLPLKDPLWVALSSLLIPLLAWRFRNYDVLLGANQPGPWLALVTSKILGKPYVVYLAQALRLLHPRTVDVQNGVRIREGDHRFLMTIKRIGGGLIDKADRVSVSRARAVLTNGDHVGRWISEIYGVSTQVVPAGCHPVPQDSLQYLNRWQGSVTVNNHDVQKPFVLLTNRHSPMKRFEYALWAMKSLRRRRVQITLVITGQETEYTQQLRHLVDTLSVQGAVQFVGLVSDDQLGILYREAALYVYPSPEEDFGMGIVEAMAAGTPVVAWGNGGPTVTVVDRETGFLARPYDTDEFAERMVQLASSPALVERMGRAGHRRASEMFSYQRHCRLLEQALEEAVFDPRGVTAGQAAIPVANWVQEEIEAASRER